MAQMNIKTPVHLLLIFVAGLMILEASNKDNNKVIASEGAVWFGKMGSPVSQTRIDRLNKQVQEDIPTFVYLVKGNRRKSTAFRGSLLLASKTLPEGDECLVPPYYADLDIPRYVKFWVKLTEIVPIDSTDLNKMRVASSVLPLGETLAKSSSGHFIIREIK